MTGGGFDIPASWVEISFHAKFKLPRKLPPAISLLFRTGGGRRLEELKLRLTQPSLAGSGAELGKKTWSLIPPSTSPTDIFAQPLDS